MATRWHSCRATSAPTPWRGVITQATSLCGDLHGSVPGHGPQRQSDPADPVLRGCAPVGSPFTPAGGPGWSTYTSPQFTLADSGSRTIGFAATNSSGDNTSFIDNVNLVPVNLAPAVIAAASASPNSVSGAATNLSVLGADDAGEANLTYTWSATGTPPAAVSFSANGSNAAKNTTVTFAAAGDYNLQVAIGDQGGLSATSAGENNVRAAPGSPASALLPANSNLPVEIPSNLRPRHSTSSCSAGQPAGIQLDGKQRGDQQ